MPSRLLRSFIIVFCLAGLAGAATADDSDFAGGGHHALIIGNNDYKHLPKLQTAVNDAETVADLLARRYGFKTTLLLNATRMQTLLALNRLRAELTEEDKLLIYYAGHGTLERETQTGYWLPIDAQEDNDIHWIANADLTRRLRGMSARHVMVVADSCYSGTLVRSVEVRPATGHEELALLRRLDGKRSRTAIVSGGLEPVVDGGANGHSVFANAFLTVLRETNEPLHGGTLYEKLSRKVIVNADQTPQYADVRLANHEGGAFVLVPKGWQPGRPAPSDTAQPVAPPVPPPQSSAAAPSGQAAEIAFWQSIKDEEHPAVFQAYLQQYPDGTFAPLARLRMQELEGGRSSPRPPVTVAPDYAIDEFDGIMITSANANLRSGPTVTSDRVGSLRRGTEIIVTGRYNDGEWYRLQTASGENAYIFGKLLVSPEVWASQQQPAARQGSGERRYANLPPSGGSDGPGIRFINSTGRNIAASTQALVQDVIRESVDPALWRQLSAITLTLTDFSIRREQNPELFGRQLARSILGVLVPDVNNSSQYMHIHSVSLSIAATGLDGQQNSDSARTEQYDYTDRNQVNILLNTLLDTARRAGGRLSTRVAGGVPPQDTQFQVVGKRTYNQ